MNTFPYSLEKHTEQKPIIGIIGGSGPDAAINFQIKLSSAMKRILKARTDAEHYRVLVDNNTQVTEQHSYSTEGEFLPQGYLQSVSLLKKMGANIITIPCNSAHAYYEEIKKEASPAFLVNMIDETCHFLAESCLNYRSSIGLLAVNETIHKNIYDSPLREYGFRTIIPDNEIQKKVLQAIVAIKAGIYNKKFTIQRLSKNNQTHPTEIIILDSSGKGNYTQNIKSPAILISEAIEHLRKKGACCILLGCTEQSSSLNR